MASQTSAPAEPGPGLDAFEALEARLEAIESQLAEICAAHHSGRAHANALDKATNAIAERAAAAVQEARDAAAAERFAKARVAAGDRVRIRAVREVDVWIGPRSERLRLSPTNVRADVCRVLDRATWEAMLARPESEVRQLVTDGAILAEDVMPDEAARIEARS
jgi:hypothetical protein